MTKIRFFTFSLIPIIGFLAWTLFRSIQSEIDLADSIQKSEAAVISKLKMIRKAEKAFFSTYNYYVSNWDSLVNFLENGIIYNVETREVISKRRPDDPLFYTQTDSIRIEYDTLGSSIVQEALFPKEKYPYFNSREIMIIPDTDGKFFDIFTGKIKKGGVTVNVIEVVDKYPLDRYRSDENESRKRKFLRFGSREEVTITGNWE